MRKGISIAAAMGVIVLSLGAGRARGAEFHGSLGMRSEYDDNITLRPNNELGDYRLTLEPRLSLSQEKAGNSLLLSYTSRQRYHYEHSEQDTFRHTLSLAAESDPEKKISAALRLDDTYRFFLRDPRQLNQPVVVNNLAKGNNFSAVPSLRFRLGTSNRLILDYRYSNIFYENFPSGRDSQSHGASIAWERQLGEDALLSLRYGYVDLRFDQPLTQQFSGASGYEDNLAEVKLSWRLSPQADVQADYLQGRRDYDNGQNLDYATWQTQLALQLFQPTRLRLNYSQSLTNDVFGRSYKSRGFGADLSQEIGKRVTLLLEASSRRITYQRLNRNTSISKAGAGLRVQLGGKVSLQLNESFQDWSADPGDTSRKIYTSEVLLSHQVNEWFSCELRYVGIQSKSNFALNEYDVSRYSLSLRAAF